MSVMAVAVSSPAVPQAFSPYIYHSSIDSGRQRSTARGTLAFCSLVEYMLIISRATYVHFSRFP